MVTAENVLDSSLLQIDHRDRGTIVTPLQKQFLSATESRPIWDQISKIAHDENCQTLVLDLIHVTFVSSEILGEFIELTRTMKRHSGQLVLCHVCSEIHDVIQLMKLDQVLTVTDNCSDITD